MQKNGYTSRDVSKAISGFCIILALIATLSLFSGIGKGGSSTTPGNSDGTSSGTVTGSESGGTVDVLTEFTVINSKNSAESVTFIVPEGFTFQHFVRGDYDTSNGALTLRASDNRVCYNGYPMYSQSGSDFASTYNTDIAKGTFYYFGEPAEDELTGVWVLNNDLEDIGEPITFNVDFSVNGESYSSIAFSAVTEGNTLPIHVGNLMSYGDEPAYFWKLTGIPKYFEGWQFDNYRAISITSKLAEVENGEELLAYLQANGTKQSASATELITFSIEGVLYQALAGMTWGEWCDSDFDFNDVYSKELLKIIENGDINHAVSTNGVLADILPSTQITANGEYKLTGYPDELPVWNGTDLTGTTWDVPSGWVTESNQSAYIADYTSIVDGTTYTGNFIGLGHRGNGIYRANEIALGINDEYGVNAMLNNSTQFTITITGGTDATNTSLIAWLKANGELTSHQMPTPTLITFTIDGKTYQAEEGMTWQQWCASEYNTDGFRADSGGSVFNSNQFPISGVKITDFIISGNSYKLNSQQMGGAD